MGSFGRLGLSLAVATLSLAAVESVAIAADAPSVDSSAENSSAGRSTEAQPSSLASNDEAEQIARFDSARSHFEVGQYEACVDELSQLESELGKEQQADIFRDDIRLYWASCLIALGKNEAGEEVMRRAILANPQMAEPDRLIFPEAVVERFFSVRGQLVEEIRDAEARRLEDWRRKQAAQRAEEYREEQRIEELERRANQTELVAVNRRGFAYVPFGVGQFQNEDDVLAYVFLSSELLFGTTSLVAFGAEIAYRTEGAELTDEAEQSANYDNIQTARTIGVVTGFTTIGLMIAGIIEANLNFKAEIPLGWRNNQKEEQPKLKIHPISQQSESGMAPGLGLDLRF